MFFSDVRCGPLSLLDSLACGFPEAFLVSATPLPSLGFEDFEWSQLPDAVPLSQIVSLGFQATALQGLQTKSTWSCENGKVHK